LPKFLLPKKLIKKLNKKICKKYIEKMKISLILFSFLNSLIIILSQNRRTEFSANDFVNSDVRKSIDLTNTIIKIETVLTIKCQRVDPIFTYRFPLLKNNSQSLVHLKATLKSVDGREEVSGVKVNKLNRISDTTYDFYEVNFKNEPMNNEEERILVIEEDYSGRLEMLPKRITLKEDQLVVYSDTQNYLSVYTTKEQRTEVILPNDSTEVLSYSEAHAERLRDRILYHLNFAIEPLRTIPLRIHYEYNHPLTVFNYAHKIFEVSHWGNVAIEERYQIENVGAKLEGEFGRVDYDDRGRHGGRNALRRLRAKLPLRSNNLWYRDEIGNVSTSRAVRNVTSLIFFIFT